MPCTRSAPPGERMGSANRAGGDAKAHSRFTGPVVMNSYPSASARPPVAELPSVWLLGTLLIPRALEGKTNAGAVRRVATEASNGKVSGPTPLQPPYNLVKPVQQSPDEENSTGPVPGDGDCVQLRAQDPNGRSSR